MALPKKIRTQDNISNIHEGSFLTSKKEVEELVIKLINKLFTINSEEFNDFNLPIAWSCDDFDCEILENELHKIKGCEMVTIDDCDSINDIINNNFKF